MKKAKILMATAIMMLLAIPVRAQEHSFQMREDNANIDSIEVQTDLTGLDKKYFQTLVISKVRQFNMNLSTLWEDFDARKQSRSDFDSCRKELKRKTLNLFVGKGDNYYGEDTVAYKVYMRDGKYYYKKNDVEITAKNVREDEKGVLREYLYEKLRHEGPKMEVTSLRTKTKKLPKLMKRYVEGIQPKPGTTVKTKSGGYQMVEKLQKVGENHYMGSVAYYQEYVSYNSEGKVRYADRTYKTMNVHLFLKEVEVDGQKLKKWEVLLGDVQATETEAI